MGLLVSSVSVDVSIPELGITIPHPTTDKDLGAQFSTDDIKQADSLTIAIRTGTLTWKKVLGGSVQTPTDYDPEFVEAEAENLGAGLKDDRTVTFKDLWGVGQGSVVPPFVFSKDGGTGVGTYLRVGNVPSNLSGQQIRGSNYIVALAAEAASVATSTTRIQFQRRTAVSTWSDITGAYVDIANGAYSGKNSGLSIAIGADWEIGCYVKSGATLSNPVALLYAIPQGT